MPTLIEREKINVLCRKLNDLRLDVYWVDFLEEYLLKMSDLEVILKEMDNLNYVWCIEPQSYSRLTNQINGDMIGYFYKHTPIGTNLNLAVTGSGCDTWILYKEGLLEAMRCLYKRLSEESIKNITPQKRYFADLI